MAVLIKGQALEDVKQQVLDDWRMQNDERAALKEEWKRCLMAWLCMFDKRWAEYAKQANRSCRYLALSWDAVETVVPQLVAAAMSHPDWLKIDPARDKVHRVSTSRPFRRKVFRIESSTGRDNPRSRTNIRSSKLSRFFSVIP